MSVGVIVDNLGINDRNICLISCLNKLAATGTNPIVFYKEHSIYPFSPTFTILNQADSFSFNGVLVATSFDSAKLALQNFDAKKKICYLWDLDWMFSPQNDYTKYVEIFLNPHLKFAVRSNDHAKIYKRVWGKSVSVIEEYDYEQFTRLITNLAD